MDIRFVSSLTAEDENAFAPALLQAVGALLDQLPIAYTIRIETTGAQIFQHSHAEPQPAAAGASPVSSPGAVARMLAGPKSDEPVRHRLRSPSTDFIV